MSLNLYKYQPTHVLTPDEAIYWAAAGREAVPRPYNMRVLLPFLLGRNARAWALLNTVGITALCILTAIYAGSVWALPLAFLGPMVWFWRKHPILVDVTGLCLALCVGLMVPHSIALAVLLSLLAGAVNEKAPVFGALYGWSFWPLLGLIAPILLARTVKPGPIPPSLPINVHNEMTKVLARKPLEQIRLHAQTLWNAREWVLPWGGMLFATMAWSANLTACLAVAYGMVIFATDRARMYVWAMPVMAAAVCTLSWDVVALAAITSYALLPITVEAR